MKTFKVALIVQNCIAGNYEKNFESTLGFISKAAQKDAKFIVFPEMNLTGYTAGPDIKKISRPITREYGECIFKSGKKTGVNDTGRAGRKNAKKKYICIAHGFQS